MLKKLVATIVLVLVLAGVAFYLLFLKDDPAPELSVDAPVKSGEVTTTAADAGEAVRVDGTWSVDPSGDNAVGFRIQEEFIGGAAKHTAVGRTKTVSGAITIAGTKVTVGTVTADLTDIEFTDDPPGLDVVKRKGAIERVGLETSKFPRASFRLTEPIDLGKMPPAGQLINASATGDLTLHGVTKPVTFGVEGKVVNGQVLIATAKPVPVVLTDYGMTPPSGIGPAAKVADTGQFEFKLTLSKA